VYALKEDFSKEGKVFDKNFSFAVPLKQKQYRLIKSLFEESLSFADTTFYDVSSWAIPYAYDIPFVSAGDKEMKAVSDVKAEANLYEGGKVIGGESSYAYVFRWNRFNAPEVLFSLQQKGIRVKAATGEFQVNVENRDENFTYGAILIPVADQRIGSRGLFKYLTELSAGSGINFYALDSGLTGSGIDLGSNNFSTLAKPEILMIVGNGVSSRDAGELWHLFDRKYKIPVCLVDIDDFNSANLDRYNTLILPGGSFERADDDKIKIWIQKGNTLIAFRNAARWLSGKGLLNVKYKPEAERDSTASELYADRSPERAKTLISGAIFKAGMDITHPLCYGYSRSEVSIFKTGTTVAESSGTPYAEPVKFTGNPLVSGYASPQNIERIEGAPVVSVQRSGRGKIIAFNEDMDFRGYWLGTNKLVANAVFFGGIIR